MGKTIAKCGTKWAVKRGAVQLGREATGVAWGLQNWPGYDYKSSVITPDDFPPEVAPKTLLVSVPVERFNRFVAHVVKMLENDDEAVYMRDDEQAMAHVAP